MKRSTKYRFLLPNVKNSILEPVFVTKQLFVLFIIDTYVSFDLNTLFPTQTTVKKISWGVALPAGPGLLRSVKGPS